MTILPSNMSTVAAPLPAGLDVDLLEKVWSFLLSTRYELFLFVAALMAHFLLFGKPITKAPKRFGKAKGKLDDGCGLVEKTPRASEALSGEQLCKNLNLAFEDGNHREVLRCWNAAKRCPSAPALPLARVVESMQRFKKDTTFIISELKGFLRRGASSGDAGPVNDLLESLGSRFDSGLMTEVVEAARGLGIKPDPRTYEILLSARFMLRDFAEVRRLAEEAEARGLSLTTKATVVVIKAGPCRRRSRSPSSPPAARRAASPSRTACSSTSSRRSRRCCPHSSASTPARRSSTGPATSTSRRARAGTSCTSTRGRRGAS